MFAPRLINPVVAVIHRLDAASTWAEDPPGVPDKGFDSVFKEFRVYDDPARTNTRQELAAIEVKAQVEQESYENLVATFGGDSPVTDTVLVLHRRYLKRAGLILADGRLDIPKGSRVSKLYHPTTREQLVPDFEDEFVYEARPRSWGYRGKVNLYILYFYRRKRLGGV
jgi:hypothetical protein